jgi:hypothetical protein
MSASIFHCQMGLSQEDCSSYEQDLSARLSHRFAGCPSCMFRIPANEETEQAEDTFAQSKEAQCQP